MVLRAGAFVYRVCYLRIKEDILPHPLHINLLVKVQKLINWFLKSIEFTPLNLFLINIAGKHSEFAHYKCNLYKAHSPGEAVYAAPVGDLSLKHSSFGTQRHGRILSSSVLFFSSRCPVLYLLQLNPPVHLLSCATDYLTCSSV